MSALRVILLTAAALGLAAPAQAQVYTQASLAPGQPYAIEVAPGTYMIQRAGAGRSYPYVGCGHDCGPGPAQLPAERPVRRARSHNDPALIEELRRRHTKKSDGKVINTVKIVREKPIVIERRRIVDDPPRVVERYRYDDGRPAKRADVHVHEPRIDEPRDRKKGPEHRVIHAEAEVTILGPDSMNIRLYRKQSRGTAKAQAD